MSTVKRVMNFKNLTIYIPKEINALNAPKNSPTPTMTPTQTSTPTPTNNGPPTVVEKKTINNAYF